MITNLKHWMYRHAQPLWRHHVRWAAGLIGLGRRFGRYGVDYAYFESAHAPPRYRRAKCHKPNRDGPVRSHAAGLSGVRVAARQLRDGIASVYANPANHRRSGAARLLQIFLSAAASRFCWLTACCFLDDYRQFIHHGVAHFKLLDFPGHGHGEFVDKTHRAGHFEV